MVNAQEWLDANYPKSQRKQITELDISNQNLHGSLKLEGFANLEIINSENNQLIELNIKNCSNLRKIRCIDNFLTNLDCSQNEKLEYLGIKNNNFFEQDLSFLSHLINLENL